MMNSDFEDNLADDVSKLIVNGFEGYCSAFAAITRRARHWFESRNWTQGRQDTLKRLDLYTIVVKETVDQVITRMGRRAGQKSIWEIIKRRFAGLIQERRDGDLARTFYNSVNRKVLNTVGFEPVLAFGGSPDMEHLFAPRKTFLFERDTARITSDTIAEILMQYTFRTPFVNLELDARLCASRIANMVESAGGSRDLLDMERVHIEMVRAPFFRGMSAYLVGRICRGDHFDPPGHPLGHPLVFSVHNTSKGLQLDAVLTTIEQMRVLFSFSHAYFHVETDCPSQLVAFLRQLMPDKRLAEIYIALGYHKHGKTELYRDLLKHQKVCSQDQFDFSPGMPGMVMIAFNMPNDDLIYKLIRDRFDSPKTISARQVMEKYEYVFKHDRAGRLLDVQTFENLELEDCCFTPQLLREIRSTAQKAAKVRQGHVLLELAYVERRVTPLDVFLQSATARSAKAVVLDYGRAIKDMARINIFPGDMLLKNFGVTSLRRVVFYDYDEVQPVTECNFRKLPQARKYDDALEAEPWFMVAENDVFPEEFGAFLGLPPDLRELFLKYHGDLLQPEFWWRTQDQIRSGVWIHIRPYGDAQRLHPES